MMRIHLLVTAATIVAASQTKVWCKPSCDQQAYDNAYKTIIGVALKSDLNPEDINHRNDTIEALRALCQGQVSSWERGK